MAAETGGSLYFDDVDRLPPAAWAEFLRLVEASRHATSGRPRLLASTWRHLTEVTSERAALAEPQRSVQIQLPPLQSRPEDVPDIVEHFLARARAHHGEALALSTLAMDALSAYPWPGNLEELQRCLVSAVATCEGLLVGLDDLPPAVRLAVGRSKPGSGTYPSVLSLEQVEREHIERVLAAAGGNKARAARLLGVDRTTLYRKLQRQSDGVGEGREQG
jgi:DNA-binding NtrC family response regulator